MRRVFVGENPFLAEIVRGYLETCGIHAVVQGEDLFGARLEIGMDRNSLPGVWVNDEDAERAERALRDRGPPEVEEAKDA